jgi:hypothetical protein
MKGACIVTLGVLLLVACSSDKLPEPSDPAFCETIDATYLGVMKEIIDATCATPTCHRPGNPAPGDFRTYNGMRAYFNDTGIKFYVIDLRDDPQNGMPPNREDNPGIQDLNEEDFEAFVCWINAGYPES